MSKFSEADLVIPTLKILVEKGGVISTSELIEELTKILHPFGEDNDILSGRSDTKFSQKVRNLKSHRTLSKKGFAVETHNGFAITAEGIKYIEHLTTILK